jgi:hypothetical protein
MKLSDGKDDINENLFEQRGVDQQQTDHDNSGYQILPTQWLAQGFVPTVKDLTAVQLYIFKHGNPPSGLKFTVSIRETLNGSDLTSTVVNADQIEDYKWVSFDFPDITVEPGKTYYIVCRCDGGEDPDVYCWFCSEDNPYEQGCAWSSHDEGLNWHHISNWHTHPTDFCFKTWYTESENKMVNHPFFNLLQRYPILFQIVMEFFQI